MCALNKRVGSSTHPTPISHVMYTAQEWRNRTLVGHEPLICSAMCFTKTETVQLQEPMVQNFCHFFSHFFPQPFFSFFSLFFPRHVTHWLRVLLGALACPIPISHLIGFPPYDTGTSWRISVPPLDDRGI